MEPKTELALDVFTPDVQSRLRLLRTAIAGGQITDELPYSPKERRRLEFARWLVQTGRLSENTDTDTHDKE